jgi:hypothetical protein
VVKAITRRRKKTVSLSFNQYVETSLSISKERDKLMLRGKTMDDWMSGRELERILDKIENYQEDSQKVDVALSESDWQTIDKLLELHAKKLQRHPKDSPARVVAETLKDVRDAISGVERETL